MTSPRDEEPGAETDSGQSDSESQPESFAPSWRYDEPAPPSQGDLWAPEPASPSAFRPAGAEASAAAGLAYETPEMETTRSRPHYKRIAWELTQTLVLAILIFLLVRTVAQNFRVEGPSMEPGLHDGQYLLVNKAVYFNLADVAKFVPFLHVNDGDTKFLFHGPQRGDVIVFRYPRDPDRDFIKRVIGLPGDRVRVVDGVVYVNDVALEEDYISAPAGRDLEEEEIVPPGNYFVLGDNRPNSSDSRSWGFVPQDNIIGKAMLTYWPLSDLGGVGNRSFDLGVITISLP
jgi:signal peptidase I